MKFNNLEFENSYLRNAYAKMKFNLDEKTNDFDNFKDSVKIIKGISKLSKKVNLMIQSLVS